jgi:hypothetical protein
MKMLSAHRDKSGGLNAYINGRSNKRLNATALTKSFMMLVRGGALSAALDGLIINEEL